MSPILFEVEIQNLIILKVPPDSNGVFCIKASKRDLNEKDKILFCPALSVFYHLNALIHLMAS